MDAKEPPLTPSNDATVVLLSCCAFLAYYLIARYALRLQPAGSTLPTDANTTKSPANDVNAKSRAWLLSVAVALIVSLLGLAHVGYISSIVWEAWSRSGLHEAQVLLYRYITGETALSRCVGLIFMGFLVMDLAIGVADYRQQIDPMSGWAHHVVYIALICNCLSRRICNLFIALGPLEIPTLMLAVGSIWPRLRMDLPMGIAFFLTRLVWFVGVTHVMVVFDGFSLLVASGVLILPLHIHWFRGWVRSYARRRRALVEAQLEVSSSGSTSSSSELRDGDGSGGAAPAAAGDAVVHFQGHTTTATS